MIRCKILKAMTIFTILVLTFALLNGCATTRKDWEKAITINTSEAYQEFLEKHPQSKYNQEAKNRIERADWVEAQSEAYKEFLEKHPQSELSWEARNRLDWVTAQKLNTLEAYKEFLKRHPDSKFYTEAHSRLERLRFEQFKKAFHSVKTIRIIVNQYSYRLGKINLPFNDMARRILEYAGLKVVKSDAKDYDATIKIRAINKAERISQRVYDEVHLGVRRMGEPYYSGVYLSGIISLEIVGLPVYRSAFNECIEIPERIKQERKYLSADSLGDIDEYNSFLSSEPFYISLSVFVSQKLLEIIGEMYGYNALIAFLQDENWTVRSNAAEALGQIKDIRAVEPLIATLKDEDEDVRSNAAEALGEIKDTRAVEALIAGLKDKDWRVRRKAAEALGQIKDIRAVEPLIATLKDEDEDVRSSAAEALGQIKDIRAVEPLIATLKDENEDVRSNAAEALGEIKDTRAVEALIAGLKDKDWRVRRKAAEVLGKIKDTRAVEALIAALKDGDVRDNAVEALVKIGVPAVEPLIAGLKDENEYVRRKAAEALGKIKDIRAVEPLSAALKDEDEYVRSNAAEALGQMKDIRAVQLLITFLQDMNKTVRSNATEALGQIKDIRAVEPLLATLKDEDEDEDVRSSAAEALGQIKDIRAVEPLIATLKDEDENEDVRSSAAKALGQIKDSRAVEPLIASLKHESQGLDESGKAERRIQQFLQEVKSTLRGITPQISGDLAVRRTAAAALGKIKDGRAVEPLIAALKDEDEDVRENAAEALEEITTLYLGNDYENWIEWWQELAISH